MRISHEAIYQALYIYGLGELPREQSRCLRSGHPLRVPRARCRTRGKHFATPEVSINQRPALIEQRKTAGHWEGDLILGLDKSAIGTLVERKTRCTMQLHLPRMNNQDGPRRKNGLALAGHGADAVRSAITSSISALPMQLRRSLTWDQGAEMSQQRGTNENTNGLLRQYFPKGTDFSRYGAAVLHSVAKALNDRPRKALGWKTPAEAFAACL